MLHRPQSKSNSVALAMETTNVVLTTLEDASRLSSIPYLQDAAGLALGIVNAIQDARDNKESFQRLADDACALVCAAIMFERRKSHREASETSELLDNTRVLLRTLTDIESFATKLASRNPIMGIIKHKSDIVTIQAYRESLRQSLDLFGLKSSMTIQDITVHLVAQQEELTTEIKILAMRDEERRVAEQQRTGKEKAEEERVAREQGRKEIRQSMGMGQEIHGRASQETSAQDQRMYQTPVTSSSTTVRQTNPFRTSNYDSTLHQPAAASVSNPFQLRLDHPVFSHIQSSNGKFKFTSIGGDQNTTDASHHVVHTNSGNTTTTTTTNSNNDSSIRISAGRHRGQRGRVS